MPWLVCKCDRRFYAPPSQMDTATCEECKRVTLTETVTTYPNGAKSTVIEGPGGYRVAHLELPYHEDSIYERLLDPNTAPAPTDQGEGEAP